MNEHDPTLRRAIETLRVPDAPPDLAERVLRRIRQAPAAPRRAWPVAVAALTAACAIAVAVWVARRPAPSEGRLVTAERVTVGLGGRGVAVAEAGAEMVWTIDRGGAARVEQAAGSVFYRVEPGGRFVVETPAGAVTVRGTCFRVEVDAMRVSGKNLAAAAVGAALSAAIVVTVYEGRVLLANPHGEVELQAGERALARSAGAPMRQGAELAPAPAGASRDELVLRNRELVVELGRVRERTARLEEEIDSLRAGQAAPVPSPVDPAPDELLAWAEKCEIHLDSPNVYGATPRRIRDAEAAEWGLAPAEREAIDAAVARLHERARVEMREIYLAATGNAAGADELTADSMMSEVMAKAAAGEGVRARMRMARERAGLAEAPEVAAQPAYERALRLMARMGNDLEAELAAALTPERARQLRKHHGGWPGLRYNDSGCEDRAP
jgi:ferric-dicitrate binding protein FerR (iron transport regulator)